MKDKILFGALLIAACTFSIQVMAQLEVKTSGAVKASGNLEVVDSLKVGNILRVNNNTTILHNLTVGNNSNITKNLTIGRDLDVNNNLIVGNELDVDNNLSVGNLLTIGDSLTVGNRAVIANNLNVGTFSTTIAQGLTIGKNLNVIQDANINKNLKVIQNAAVGDTINNNISLNVAHIANHTTNPCYGIYSHAMTQSSMPTSSIYGVCAFADASNTDNIYPSLNQVVGVFGKAYKTSYNHNKFSAGVAGMADYYSGIGVYGAIGYGGLNLPSACFGTAYAGYFSGTVRVNGSLIATTLSTISDARMEENVQAIQSSISDRLQLLNPVSFTLKQDSVLILDKDAKEMQGLHYGFVAQDVQQIFPEIVYERSDQLSINYIELIPLLIKTIQELSDKVVNQQSQIDVLTKTLKQQ